MTFQFGSMRSQLCAPVVSLGAGNLGNSGTLYFWLQGRNACGFNLPSEVGSVTYTATDSIEITLPADCYREGESIDRYVITANTEDDPSTSKVLINLDANNLSLPVTITLSEPDHIEIESAVDSFPTGTALINGLVRQLNSTGLVYRYNSSSTLAPDGNKVISATQGNWESLFDGFNSFVEDTEEDSNGCDLNVLDIINPERVLSKNYALDGSAGPSRTYWITNDTSESIPQGTRVGLTVSINGEAASEEFEGFIKVVFEGYVDAETGNLDVFESDGLTFMEGLNVEKDYQFGRTDLVLQKPLEPNTAYRIRIFPQFNAYELQNVPPTGVSISVIGFLFDEAGSYNEASSFIGNAILPDNPGLRRIYPTTGLSVFSDEGSGTVAGFFFKDIGSNVIPGLLDNTANQNIAINNNGTTYLNSSTIDSNEDLRAVVSTVSGESKTSPFSASITADNSPDITCTVNYPSEIDSNYDGVIAGSNKGTFNAEEISIYVRQNGSEIKRFTGFAPTNTVSDSFTVSWSSGTTVSDVVLSSFGLYQATSPGSVTATTTGSDTYEVAVGFIYLGNSVTSISHKESDGCITEFLLSLSDLNQKVLTLEEAVEYWKEPISSYAALKAKEVASLIEGQSNRVSKENDVYEIWTWDSSSLAVSDDSSFIRPDEFADDSEAGRWVKVSGGSSSNTARVTGSRITLTENITLNATSSQYLSLDNNSNDYTVTLYNGGSDFYQHTIIHKGTTNTISVVYDGNTLETLTTDQILAVLWDTEDWIIL